MPGNSNSAGWLGPLADGLRALRGAGTVLVGLGALAMAAGAPSLLWAAEWTVSGHASQSAFYDNNVRLQSSDKDSTFGFITSPRLDLNMRTPRFEAVWSNRFDLGLHTANSDLNYEDVGTTLEMAYRGQLSTIGLDAGASYDTTLTSEETDTGDFDEKGRRFGIDLAPYWNYFVTPRDQVGASALYNRVRYSDAGSLEDFSYYAATVFYHHRLTEQDRLGGSVTVSHFENDDVSGEETDTIAGRVIWDRDFSERLHTQLFAGANYSMADEVSFPGGMRRTSSTNSIGVEAGGSIDWELDPVTNVSGSLERTIAPSGGGNAVERTTVAVSADHQFRPNWTALFQSYYQRNERPSGGNADDRDFVSVSPGVKWRFARNWNASTNYRFRWQNESSDDSATSHRVLLTISYEMPPWDISD